MMMHAVHAVHAVHAEAEAVSEGKVQQLAAAQHSSSKQLSTAFLACSITAMLLL